MEMEMEEMMLYTCVLVSDRMCLVFRVLGLDLEDDAADLGSWAFRVYGLDLGNDAADLGSGILYRMCLVFRVQGLDLEDDAADLGSWAFAVECFLYRLCSIECITHEDEKEEKRLT